MKNYSNIKWGGELKVCQLVEFAGGWSLTNRANQSIVPFQYLESKVSKIYLKVQCISKYLKVQGIQKVPKGPKYPKNT